VPILGYILTAVVSYLLGSVPTGYLAGRARGIDIRTVGSGNMGATNVFRVLGKTAGIIVLLIDALKGYAACAWVSGLFAGIFKIPPEQADSVRILAGICAVLGHNYTCWLGFKGGKGVATTTGVFLALAPLAIGIAVGTWIIVVAASRYVSVASITAAAVLGVTIWILKYDQCLRLVTTGLCVLAILKHKSNIQRLMNGTEQRFGRKNETPEAAK
jgi:glycerol-3-phosphate acyltransferase PlsY